MKALFSLLAVIALTSLASAKDWLDDLEKAKTQAKAEKKAILLDFTGSDWCGWCMKLDKEVFSKSDFKTFAKANLILVEVDFPHGKKLSKKVAAQNDDLKSKYGVKGFPTLVMIDTDGKELHRIGGYKADALDDLKKAVEANKPK